MRSPAVFSWKRFARTASIVVPLGLAVCGSAQVERPSTAKNRPVQPGLAASKVTVADMNKAFAKLEGAVRNACGISGKKKPAAIGSATVEATREQVVLEFDRLYELAKPHFKFTPHKIKFDATMLTIKKGTPARTKLDKLIAWQCVAKVGPLAASLTPTLTLEEFGDAIGFFAARMADLTHTPSGKWSPYMNERSHAPGAPGTSKSRVPASKS